MAASSHNKYFIGFLVVFTFLLYFQSLNYQFIQWDDDKQITENPRIKQITKENISYNFLYERYTAISLYSYMIDYKLWGQYPAAFRMVNILLHLLNVVLVFFLIFFLTSERKTAFFTALLFACHPLRVESVVWISERKDVLFALWGLLSLLSYRKYLVSETKIYYVIAFALAILSSLSKIQGILIPFTFFLLDYWYNRKVTIRMAFGKIIILVFIFFIYTQWTLIPLALYFLWFFAPETLKRKLTPGFPTLKRSTVLIIAGLITAGFLAFLYFANPFGIWEPNTPSKSALFGITDRLFLATYSFSHYIIKFIAPVELSAVYPYPAKTDGLLPVIYYLSTLILIPAGFFIYYLIRKKKIAPVFVFGLAFFALNISIVLHIMPIEGRLVVADRYTYFAYIGLFFIAAYSLIHYIKNIKLQWVMIIAAVGLLSFRNVTRQPVWEDTGTLFTDVIEKDSNIAFAVNNLAVYELYNNRTENALAHINRSISLDSTDPMSWYNQGLIFFNLSRHKEALRSYNTMMKHAYTSEDTALALNDMGQCYIALGIPDTGVACLYTSILISDKIPSAFNNLGWYYYLTGQNDSAKAMFKKALLLNPDYPEALNNMGSLLFSSGKGDSALPYFDRSIELRPTYALAHNNRGYYMLMKNDMNRAMQSFNRAIAVDPKFLQAYQNRAWVYYNQKEYDKAISDYNFILSKDSTYITAYTNRAFSLFMAGKTDEAIKDFTAAIKLQPQNPDMYANRGRAYLQSKQFEKAAVDFSDALKLKVTDVYYQARGIAFYETGKKAEALKDLNESIRLNPNNSESLFYLGRIMTDAGKKDKACDYFSRAAELGSMAAKAEAEKCKGRTKQWL